VKNEDYIQYLSDNNIKEIYWEEFISNPLTKYNDWINYEKIIKEINFKNEKQIEAYYVKKPSIC
jgi:hypothetical protein